MSIEIELAWAAGFYDGEGGIYVDQPSKTTKNKNLKRLKLCITQKDTRPLDRFIKAVGCGVYYGPYTNGKCAQVQINGEKALDVIRKLYPYLCEPKREQAIKAITESGRIL